MGAVVSVNAGDEEILAENVISDVVVNSTVGLDTAVVSVDEARPLLPFSEEQDTATKVRSMIKDNLNTNRNFMYINQEEQGYFLWAWHQQPDWQLFHL